MGERTDGMSLLIGFLVVSLSVTVLAVCSWRISRQEEENQLVQAYMVTLQSFYQMLQDRIEVTRRYRHDLAKHIQTLEVLMAEEGKEELREYADGLKLQYQELKSDQYCASEVINTVISIKRQQCEEKQIPFTFTVEPGGYGAVRDIDMVGILYNLLDNAVEENERIPDGASKGIWLLMGESDEEESSNDEAGNRKKQKKQQERAGAAKEYKRIWMEVRNCIRPDTTMDFKTEKQDKDAHGVGRKIISYLVKQYQGTETAKIDREKNELAIRIWLKRREAE